MYIRVYIYMIHCTQCVETGSMFVKRGSANINSNRADPITTQLDLDSWRKSEKSLRNTLKLVAPQHYIYIHITCSIYIYV